MSKPSTRTLAAQNLMVTAVNTALERGLITLACEPVLQATFEFRLGGHPVIANLHDAGFDEVSIYVTCRPTEMGRRFINCMNPHEWRRFGEAIDHGWLERRTGKYLQNGYTYRGTREMTQALGAMVIEPHGFDTKTPKGGYDFQTEFEGIFGPPRKQSRQTVAGGQR